MRKGTILIVCLMVFAVWNVRADQTEPEYIIRFDTESHDEIKVKNEVVAIYDEMMKQVSSTSRASLLAKNTELFEYRDDITAEYANGVLTVTVGDGKGFLLEGTFEKDGCQIEVNRKSWILELFD